VRGVAGRGGEVPPDGWGDKTGCKGRAVIVQDRNEPYRVDAALVDDQRAQLCVAILLDHENEVVVRDKAVDAGMEGESAHAHAVERVSTCLDHMDRLVHRGRGGAIVDHSVFGWLSRVRD